MFNLFSPKDQVSNFIVNNAYSAQTEKFTFKLRIKPQCYDKKISINSITPSRKTVLTYLKCFSAFKNTLYPSIICSNDSV